MSSNAWKLYIDLLCNCIAEPGLRNRDQNVVPVEQRYEGELLELWDVGLLGMTWDDQGQVINVSIPPRGAC
jgi:hypothetical protein